MIAPPESRAFEETDHLLHVFPTELKAFPEILVGIPAFGDDAGRDDRKEAAFGGELHHVVQLVHIERQDSRLQSNDYVVPCAPKLCQPFYRRRKLLPPLCDISDPVMDVTDPVHRENHNEIKSRRFHVLSDPACP